MRLSDTWVGVLTAFAAIGIGAGSLAAGRLSGDKVELGLAPIGAIGMGVFAIALSRSGALVRARRRSTSRWSASSADSSPCRLNALLQQRSGGTEKGRLMATNNFLNMVAIMLASAALSLCIDVLRLAPDRILLIFGVAHAAVEHLRPQHRAGVPRPLQPLAVHAHVYRIRIVGQEHVPFRGPALLVCNHLSHVDGPLVGACVQRFVRFLVYKPYLRALRLLRRLLKLMKAIPMAAGREALGVDRAGAHANCRTAMWSASSRKARSAAPATCCRSSAASSGSSKASTCRSCPSISIASGAASSASKAAASSGSGRCAFPIR